MIRGRSLPVLFEHGKGGEGIPRRRQAGGLGRLGRPLLEPELVEDLGLDLLGNLL